MAGLLPGQRWPACCRAAWKLYDARLASRSPAGRCRTRPPRRPRAQTTAECIRRRRTRRRTCTLSERERESSAKIACVKCWRGAPSVSCGNKPTHKLRAQVKARRAGRRKLASSRARLHTARRRAHKGCFRKISGCKLVLACFWIGGKKDRD